MTHYIYCANYDTVIRFFCSINVLFVFVYYIRIFSPTNFIIYDFIFLSKKKQKKRKKYFENVNKIIDFKFNLKK
jgi:hypothetical protein